MVMIISLSSLWLSGCATTVTVTTPDYDINTPTETVWKANPRTGAMEVVDEKVYKIEISETRYELPELPTKNKRD